MNNNICPKCGGRIVAEAFGSYGTVFYVRKDGSLGRQLRNVKYGGNGDWIYYCPECGEQIKEKQHL